jgi:hypothetical protein
MALVAVGIAILVVVAVHLSQSGAQSGWEALASAQAQIGGPTVDSLETARDRGASTAAGPWIDYQLAVALFDRGDPGDLERASQIAHEAVAGHPEHIVTPPLQRLLEAIDSFSDRAQG